MSALAEVLRSRLIPWSRHDAARRFIIARPEMRQRNLPVGVQITPRKPSGKRTIVKNKRSYNNTRTVIAEWTDDGMHELSGYSLVCVLDGHVAYPVGHYQIECGPGHFIFIPPGMPRANGLRPYVDLRKSATCNLLTFLIQPKVLECWISHGHAAGREHTSYCFVIHERVLSLFQALMEEVMEESTDDRERALAVGEELLPAFLNVLHREVEAGRIQFIRAKGALRQPEVALAGAAQDDFAVRLEQYVQANLRKPLTLERVARDMYLSPAQFTRNVRRETGESFNQLLARHRLEEAKILLRDSQWTISAIAGLTGFRSTRYFCTFFKRHIGVTPGEFRASTFRKSKR